MFQIKKLYFTIVFQSVKFINMSITVFIQARLKSKRLPNKVIKIINKKTIIEHLINQISFAKKIDRFFFLIPKNDIKLKKFLTKKKIKYISGSENNVLDRFYKAYKLTKARNIIRLTADCPLIDPKIIDKLINFYNKNSYDYINLGNSFAEGQCAEILSSKVLKFLKKHAKSTFEKEHVTILLRRKKNKLKLKTLENKSNDHNLRYTLDRKEDFEVIKKIILNFRNKKYITSKQIKIFLKKNKRIFKLNRNIIRNEKTINY